MKALFTLLLSLMTGTSSFAGPQYHSQISSALDFIEHYQTTGKEGYDPGQWVTRVTSYLPSAVGVGKFNVPFDEPTAFVASSIANVLAEIYQIDSRYDKIPPMIEKTVAGFQKYYWDDLFNFYPPTTYRGVQVRQPRYMYLASYFKGFANIPPDADTTSASYATHYYLNKIHGESFELPEQVIDTLSSTRDVHRKPHVWNAGQGQKNTGAFLTWFYDEDDPKMPRNIFSKPNNGTRIPFNRNDVDCVVNAHVLKLLTLAGKTEGPGYKAACAHLNNIAAQKDFFFCGLYYPSRYVLPYSMAAILEAGGSCLEPSRDRLLNFLLRKQHKDGSWKNSILARPDRVQSTAWALTALAQLGDPKNPLHQARVRKAARFLLSESTRDRHGFLFWPGQVYFAATFVARYPVVWRSSAYTTAVAAKALLLAQYY
ncbi:MAG: terpene cyclase/mutase family protein [Bdellovibrio sp.]|nr:terpene cyclase/mutase family protein [Bdellovibrio sp.]